MGRLLWLAAALVAVGPIGCGKVTANQVAVDAAEADALVCAAPMLACGTCIDPMTDHDHCGSCDTACPTGVDCLEGHCTDTSYSCAAIKQVNPVANDGIYTHAMDNSQFYCDMTNVTGYADLGYAEFDVGHAGYVMISPTDLQNAAKQKAFIALYNNQHGLKLIAPWTDTNCCFKGDTLANNANMIYLKGSNVIPADSAGVTRCNVLHDSAQYAADEPGHFILAAGGASGDPMADNFFAVNPVTAGTGCTVGMNPAFFWKQHL